MQRTPSHHPDHGRRNNPVAQTYPGGQPVQRRPSPSHDLHPNGGPLHNGNRPKQRRPLPSHNNYTNGAPPHHGAQPMQRRPLPSHDSYPNEAPPHNGSQPMQRRPSPSDDSYGNGVYPHPGPQSTQTGPPPSVEPLHAPGSEVPSRNQGPKKIRAPCHVFDVFFDLPHPAASDNADRARMIEPPEVTNPEILAEVYEPSAIAKLARFAFPEHDDQKHGTYELHHFGKASLVLTFVFQFQCYSA